MCVNGQCVITNGKNIQCDGFPDCLDASDEKKDMCGELVVGLLDKKAVTFVVW